jgi:hypothetical protein
VDLYLEVEEGVAEEGAGELGEEDTEEVELAVLLLAAGQAYPRVALFQTAAQLQQAAPTSFDQARETFGDRVEYGSLHDVEGQCLRECREALEVVPALKAEQAEVLQPLLCAKGNGLQIEAACLQGQLVSQHVRL